MGGRAGPERPSRPTQPHDGAQPHDGGFDASETTQSKQAADRRLTSIQRPLAVLHSVA
jgi:hypothetical protein